MEGPNLDQHEIIKFLTLKGGRCTNFELVSNFRGALNHPQLQAEARLRFKDIVNTVAVVGEYQNVKYIELKKEYLDNNQVSESPTSQPSSLSSDSSYTSPLTQSFQPYWRYRLSTSTKVPILPVRSPDYDSLTKSQIDDSTFLERSVSESTLPQPLEDIQPPPRTRGLSSTAFNRSGSTNAPERTDSQSLFRKTSFLGEECLTRRSSINGYPPQQTLLDFSYSLQNYGPTSQQMYSNLLEPMPVDARRNSEVFVPERPARSHCPPSSRRDLNRSTSEHSTLSHSLSFSGPRSHLPPPNSCFEGTNCNSSNNLDKWKRDRTLPSRNGTERCPKRTGICSDDMLKELEDNPQQYMDNPISRSFNHMHGIGREQQIVHNQGKETINYSSLPDYSYQDDPASKMNHQSPISPNEKAPAEIGLELGNVTPDVKRLTRNVLSNYGQESNCSRSMISVQDSSLDYDTESISSSCSEMSNSRLEHPISRTESQRSVGNTKQPFGKIGNRDHSAPVPPERRRRHSKSTADFQNESHAQQCKSEKEVPSSTGKVKDRVQHFDDLEKRRSHHPKRGSSSPLPDKENIRGSKTNLMEDDISMSVLDPKLKREWFVKAAQGDYYALVGLLKKEPKLAAIKDIASGFTALHWAAKHGEANIVKLIAGTYRVNPNIRSNGGYTPIHLATLYKHTYIVDLLVHTYGGDASIRDYSGKKASQYPENYVRTVAGLKTTEKRPLKARPLEKESTVSAFMRIGSLNLRKSRKSAVFASVRGRNWGTPSELRLNNYKSTRKKNAKMILPEKKGDTESKNDSDSDSAYGFYSKAGIKEI